MDVKVIQGEPVSPPPSFQVTLSEDEARALFWLIDPHMDHLVDTHDVPEDIAERWCDIGRDLEERFRAEFRGFGLSVDIDD